MHGYMNVKKRDLSYWFTVRERKQQSGKLEAEKLHILSRLSFIKREQNFNML
jgi:hypothetical protein